MATTCHLCQQTFKRVNSLTRHLRERHNREQIQIECQFCTKTFSRPEHYRRHQQTQHNLPMVKTRIYPCPVCPNKIFKRKEHLRKHLQLCPTLKKMINQSEQLAESIDQGQSAATQFDPRLEDSALSELFDTKAHFALLEVTEPSAEAFFQTTESIDQGQPPATPFDPLMENIEPSAEAFFQTTESIDQGQPPATPSYLRLEDSALSELSDTEAHFALLEDITSSDEALFPSTESIDQSQSAATPFDPLLENIEPSDEAPFPSAATQFYPLLEDSALRWLNRVLRARAPMMRALVMCTR